MTTSKKLLHATFHVYVPHLALLKLEDVTADLANLQDAAPGDLLGVALGHGVGAAYRTGAVTEYCCAFLASGDGRTCDGAISARKPKDRATERAVRKCCNVRLDTARRFQSALGLPAGEFETLHFRHFAVAMIKDVAADEVTELRVFLERPRTVTEAKERCREILALFEFLCAWHDSLCRCQIEMAGPEALLGAPEAAEQSYR